MASISLKELTGTVNHGENQDPGYRASSVSSVKAKGERRSHESDSTTNQGEQQQEAAASSRPKNLELILLDEEEANGAEEEIHCAEGDAQAQRLRVHFCS